MLIFKLTLNICLRLLFLLAFLQNVYADEFDYYAHIKKYTQCEALQNVIANISNQSEKEFYQHKSHYASLDSRMIALEFAKAGNYEESMLAELYHAYLDEYRALLRQSKEVEVFAASLKPHAEKCRKLNEMQEDIIRRKREESAKANRYTQ